MLEVTGIIEDIVTENNNGSDKKVVSLRLGSTGRIFIEFQKRKFFTVLAGFSPGEEVRVKIGFNGKVSRLGRKYNNVIGKCIVKQD